MLLFQPELVTFSCVIEVFDGADAKALAETFA